MMVRYSLFLQWLINRRYQTLRGDRICLRPPLMRDYKKWTSLRDANHAFLQPREPLWQADELAYSQFRLRLKGYRQAAQQGRGHAFFIWSRNMNELMGGINLNHIRRGAAQMASIGYWLGAPFCNQGRMSEAVGLISDFAFTTLGLHRLEAACMVDNEASVSVLLKNNFKQEGYAPCYLEINGHWADHRLFALNCKVLGHDSLAF